MGDKLNSQRHMVIQSDKVVTCVPQNIHAWTGSIGDQVAQSIEHLPSQGKVPSLSSGVSLFPLPWGLSDHGNWPD